jgi:hypothetical protein
VGDFDNDGKRDLAVANALGHVNVLFGRGDGTLDYPRTVQTGQYIADIVAADFSGDGRSDLVVLCPAAQSLKVLTYTGGFNLFSTVNFVTSGHAGGLAAADFTGDLKPDLAVTLPGLDFVTLLPNNGSGGFSGEIFFAVGDGPTAVAAARDLNNDNHTDLAVTNYHAGTVSVLFGNGAGSFAPAQHFPAGSQPSLIVAGDFTDVAGQGAPDLAVFDLSGAVLSLLEGDGAGSFAAPRTMAVPNGTRAVAADHFNPDQRLDLVVANRAAPTVRLLLGAAEPVDVTGLLKIRRSSITQAGTLWRFEVSLTNLSAATLHNLKAVVVIKNDALLKNRHGFTQIVVPGKPYRNVPALAPAQQRGLLLVFRAKTKPKFSLLVFQAPGGP